MELAEQLREMILVLTASREFPKTCCVSEPPRALFAHEDQWRPLMELSRQICFQLAMDGKLEILQKGEVIPSDEFQNIRGPMRIRQILKAEKFDDSNHQVTEPLSPANEKSKTQKEYPTGQIQEPRTDQDPVSKKRKPTANTGNGLSEASRTRRSTKKRKKKTWREQDARCRS